MNHGLRGRFAPKKKSEFWDDVLAVVVIASFTGLMAYAFAGFMR